jgi:2-keto-4-pentenoate hydratase/2-oxohepta-3-ene-1,7-dioic acid hydratase in catechol pathway
LDYEVELAVVIAETCKDVSEDEAMQYVLGYMTANDVTSRRHQQEVSQWDHGKGFDGFCPIGPTLVSSQAIPDPSVLRLRTVLNSKVMQDGKARDMIFSVAKIVSFLSQVRDVNIMLMPPASEDRNFADIENQRDARCSGVPSSSPARRVG